MGITSLQACMDPAGWLQEVIQEERAMGSPPLEDMISCSRPLLERRLRPQPDPSLKCPRCDSTHTKFCYYNNYSLSQPRYFCKTCRRYWTKGGSLRNVPVGGGCRKNKRVSVKKLDPQPLNSMNPSLHLLPSSSSSIIQHDLTDLNLSFTGVHAQISHQDASLMENIRNGDFNMLANHRSNDLTVGDLGFTEGISYHHPQEFLNPNGFAINDGLIHGSGNLGYLQTSDTMGFAYGEGVDAEIKPRMLNMFNEGLSSSNIKAEDPSKRLLSLEWQDNNNYGGNNTTESSSSAYLASLSCFMNNYGLFPLN